MAFWVWSRRVDDHVRVVEGGLAATLLQWSLDDFPFREFAYAVLCLAVGGKHTTILPIGFLGVGKELFSQLRSENQSSTDTAFISSLATGAHVRGIEPGSSPKETIYWLEGVLVFLTTQLFRLHAVQNEVSRVAEYCQQHYPNDVVDAILMSIEHVVLVHVVPGKGIQHTALMPLFNIRSHLTLDVRDCYSKSYLDKLAQEDGEAVAESARLRRKGTGTRAATAMNAMEDGSIIGMPFDDMSTEEQGEEQTDLSMSQRGISGDPISTFYALIHLFDAAARRRMPPARSCEGCFPNKVYDEILKHVTDMKTRTYCLHVSRSFRRFCQENVLFCEGVLVRPCEAFKCCVEPDQVPEWFNVYDLESHERYEARLRFIINLGGRQTDLKAENSHVVCVGTGRMNKSLMTGLQFEIVKIDRSKKEPEKKGNLPAPSTGGVKKVHSKFASA